MNIFKLLRAHKIIKFVINENKILKQELKIAENKLHYRSQESIKIQGERSIHQKRFTELAERERNVGIRESALFERTNNLIEREIRVLELFDKLGGK